MSIRITTLSENTASDEGIVAEWGLSIFVEADGHKILFDTGLSFSAAYNAPILGIDLSQVEITLKAKRNMLVCLSLKKLRKHSERSSI